MLAADLMGGSAGSAAAEQVALARRYALAGEYAAAEAHFEGALQALGALAGKDSQWAEAKSDVTAERALCAALAREGRAIVARASGRPQTPPLASAPTAHVHGLPVEVEAYSYNYTN